MALVADIDVVGSDVLEGIPGEISAGLLRPTQDKVKSCDVALDQSSQERACTVGFVGSAARRRNA